MGRIENLRFIVRTLLAEQSGKAHEQLPDSLPQLQMVMRSLLNVRPPLPIGEDFLRAQDAELQWQLRDKGIVTLQESLLCG